MTQDVRVLRKDFHGNTVNEIASQRIEFYISQLADGAGTWPDDTEFAMPSNIVRGATLKIKDKMGVSNGPAMRHIEFWRGSRLVVTFVYNHFTRELVRTF